MTYRLLILLFVLSVSQHTYGHSSLDSLRVEKIKGKRFVIHRAEPKETLYAISKRYEVSVDELYVFNPKLETEGLKMYDEIKIPIQKKNKHQKPISEQTNSEVFHIVAPGETLYSIANKYNISVDSLTAINQLGNTNLSIGDTLRLKNNQAKSTTAILSEDKAKYHIVQASETLFGISRQYQVEIEDLQQWNNLTDYAISIGQKIRVSEIASFEVIDSLKVIKPVILDSIKKDKLPLDTLYVKTDNSQFKTKTSETEGIIRTVEEGFAMKIADTDYTKKHLALHRTAPLGSTIKVTNQMTNQTIEARVVGKLPESAMNQSLIMRLSAAAYKALGALDLKIPVTVSFSEGE